MSDDKSPDLYADSINVTAGPFGFTLSLYVSDPTPSGEDGEAEAVQRLIGHLRLSPELASALAKTLTQAYGAHKRHLADQEKEQGNGSS